VISHWHITVTRDLTRYQASSFRLAGKKFGHPAGMKKINLEKVGRNKPQTTKILMDKMGNHRDIAAK